MVYAVHARASSKGHPEGKMDSIGGHALIDLGGRRTLQCSVGVCTREPRENDGQDYRLVKCEKGRLFVFFMKYALILGFLVDHCPCLK